MTTPLRRSLAKRPNDIAWKEHRLDPCKAFISLPLKLHPSLIDRWNGLPLKYTKLSPYSKHLGTFMS